MPFERLRLLFVIPVAIIALSACNMPTATPTMAPTPEQSNIAPVCHWPAIYDVSDPNNISCPTDKPSITLVGTTCSQGIDQASFDLPADTQSPTGWFFASVTGAGQSACSQYVTNGIVRLVCTGAPGDQVTVVAHLDCKASDQLRPACPAGYQYDPNASLPVQTRSGVQFNASNTCNYTGSTSPSQTQCIGSEVYNPTQHCCDLSPAEIPELSRSSCPLPYGVVEFNYGGELVDPACVQTQNFGLYEGTRNTLEYVLPPCANPPPPTAPNSKTCKQPPSCVAPSYKWHQNTCICEYIPG